MIHKKSILPNGIAVDQAASLPSARRGASQTASHSRGCGRRDARRKWGLHLVRRSRIFHFRRRWPESLRNLGAPEFLSVSLRTDVLSIAAARSCRLRAAVEEGERELKACLADRPVCAETTRSLLREMVRSAVQKMMEDLEAPVASTLDTERLPAIEADLKEIKLALRQRDWSTAPAVVDPFAAGFPVQAQDLSQPAIARQILLTRLRLLELEAQVEETFDDPLHLGRDLLAQHDLLPRRDALRPPMRLSEAVEKAADAAPASVEVKIRTVGVLALDHFGDIAMTTLTYGRVLEFLEFLWWLPKHWGKSHGKNRFNQEGRDLRPSEERIIADERDAAIIEAVLADNGLSRPDKRRRLVDDLTPRLTDGYLIVQRDMFQRVVAAALGKRRVGRDLDDDERIVPSHKQLKDAIAKWHKTAKTSCGLPRRVSRPKRRRSWSIEHIAKLLLSPIYRGASSEKQRGRRARGRKRVIVRDALYWVPLIMITMGVRPEEILQLPLTAVVRRNGVYCIEIEDTYSLLKTTQSRRSIPIPQLLLDLGFLQWVRFRIRQNEIWAFPEISEDKSHGKKSQTFGDRLRNIFRTLKMECPHEDVYAMRRTLASKLLHAGVDTGVRQRILGHLEGTTVDRHYSDDGLLELKDMLDRVDYGIKIGREKGIGFPLITGCSALLLPAAAVDIELQDDVQIAGLRVTDSDTGEILFEARLDGAKLQAKSSLVDAPSRSAQECATQLVDLEMAYDLALPASEEAMRAFHHLLIFADEDQKNVAATARRPVISHPFVALQRQDEVPSVDLAPDAPSVRPQAARLPEEVGTSVGRTVLCVFPLRGAQRGDGQPRPGLVVSEKFLSGKRYLDIAKGVATDARLPRKHDLLLQAEEDLNTARLKAATCFDMRKRILVRADDGSRVQGELGHLPKNARIRMNEILLAVGDVTPVPVSEVRAGRKETVVEVHRPKRRRQPEVY